MLDFDPFLSAAQGPPLIRRSEGDVGLPDLVARERASIAQQLVTHGAVLFRGFGAGTADAFDRFVDALALPRLDYLYRSTPRTAVGERIFTATEYPADQEIPLHNENAYQPSWPLKVAFCCTTAPSMGGETPIADMRRVTHAIPADIVEKFAQRGVTYTRTYRPHLDLPWSVVFQTEDRSLVEAFCRRNGIGWEWLADGGLRTEQTCQGVAHHPVTGERLFFNQAHMFHASSLAPEIEAMLVESYGRSGLPRNACFGDGSPFSLEELDVVREAFRQAAVAFPWEAGDVLLLDNMLMAHGRRPYRGDRKVLAVLMDASDGRAAADGAPDR